MYGNYYNSMMGNMPAMPNMPQYQPTQYGQPKENISWVNVNGLQGARDVQVQANQTAWLMDMNSPIFYVKKADSMGVCTLRAYEFHEINPEQPKQSEQMFATKDELNALRDEIRALQEGTNESTGKQRTKSESDK